MYLAPALHSFMGTETRTSYTGRLLGLDSCVTVRSSRIPTVQQTIFTPLKVKEWERNLVGHPDEDLVGYVLSGIRDGFRVGFDYSKYTCVSARANLHSAGENRQVVEAYLIKERAQGRMIRMGMPEAVEGFHFSQFEVIPKGHQTGKMAADSRPVIPSREKCERWDR